MAKKPRKIKVEFSKEKIKIEKKEDEENTSELESIITTKTDTIIKVSPVMEMSQQPLEAQLADVPATNPDKKDDNANQIPMYESIKYSSPNSNYQESVYQTINFQTPPNNITLGSTPQQDFFKSPTLGFQQNNPFETKGYPKNPEQNYESRTSDEIQKQKRRRM
ncbi:hypothetical protein J4218_04165 [Candidatus Pacearchaeota archaeon]|nr:hypothetical protein [Candidatus Pacearchaeota archaeon]